MCFEGIISRGLVVAALANARPASIAGARPLLSIPSIPLAVAILRHFPQGDFSNHRVAPPVIEDLRSSVYSVRK